MGRFFILRRSLLIHNIKIYTNIYFDPLSVDICKVDTYPSQQHPEKDMGSPLTYAWVTDEQQVAVPSQLGRPWILSRHPSLKHQQGGQLDQEETVELEGYGDEASLSWVDVKHGYRNQTCKWTESRMAPT